MCVCVCVCVCTIPACAQTFFVFSRQIIFKIFVRRTKPPICNAYNYVFHGFTKTSTGVARRIKGVTEHIPRTFHNIHQSILHLFFAEGSEPHLEWHFHMRPPTRQCGRSGMRTGPLLFNQTWPVSFAKVGDARKQKNLNKCWNWKCRGPVQTKNLKLLWNLGTLLRTNEVASPRGRIW